MAFQWAPQAQAGGQLPPPSPSGYQYYYPRSANTSPYAQPVMLPTPPVAVSPLPNGPVWLPVYSPGATLQALPPSNAAPHSRPATTAPAAPVLIDILHHSSKRTASKNPHIMYDIRDYPEKALVNTKPRPVPLSDGHLDAPLTSPPTSMMKIISKDFPWEIDVESRDEQTPVTVADLLNAVHETLQKHITTSEWWIVTDKVRDAVSAAYVKNCERSSAGGARRFEIEKPREKNEGLRRVDWLLNNIIFMGLERDDEFASLRVRDKDQRAVTWVLVTAPKA